MAFIPVILAAALAFALLMVAYKTVLRQKEAPEDDKFDFSKLHDYCYERGFTIYPGKMFGMATFRLCNLGGITEKDIADFFVVGKEAFKEMGYTIPIG